MKVYLSGSISKDPDHRAKFQDAERQMTGAGYEVVNPADLVVDGWQWVDYLKHDLKILLDCDGICMLPGWRLSEGACLEYEVARALDMQLGSLDRWLERAGNLMAVG